jgi:hypothetical protein
MIVAAFFGYFSNHYLVGAHFRAAQEIVRLQNEVKQKNVQIAELTSALKDSEHRAKLATARADRLAADLSSVQARYESQASDNASARLQIAGAYAKSFMMLVSLFFLATILIPEWKLSLMLSGLPNDIVRILASAARAIEGAPGSAPKRPDTQPSQPASRNPVGPYLIDDVSEALGRTAWVLSVILSAVLVALLVALVLMPRQVAPAPKGLAISWVAKQPSN